MTDSKDKRHSGKSKDHHSSLHSHPSHPHPHSTGVRSHNSSEREGEKKDRPHPDHDTDAEKEKAEKERSEMEKIEALCKQFGVPDPGELYIIPRDFSGKPNITQFDITMPEGLARWIDEAEFEYTIGKINFLFSTAEKIDCRTVWNGVCKFLTCFMIKACQRTRAERAIVKVRNFIVQQNQDIYHTKGFHIVEPAARGLRHLEFRSITYYSMKYFLDHEDEVNITDSEMHITHHLPSVHHTQARRSVMSHF